MKTVWLTGWLVMGALAFVKADTNVALNKPVTVVAGAAQITNSSTPLSVVTDGIFTPESTGYGTPTALSDAVEWTTTDGMAVNGTASNAPTTLEIDLGGLFTITGAIVQADDNDSYLLQYHNTSDNMWQTLWTVPAVSEGFGFQTRPNADQLSFQPVGPVVTDEVRISAASGDAGLGVSELQLNGTAVPEPGLPGLLGCGALVLALLRRPRKSPARQPLRS